MEEELEFLPTVLDTRNNNSFLTADGKLYTNSTGNFTEQDLQQLLLSQLGSRRKDMGSVITLTVVYCVIFITGVVGNVSTCIVIARNAYMHTVTNWYLLSLAVSDAMALLLALPPELYTIWEAYPWRLGEPFCVMKSFLLEMTSYASVLTITGFTIERYIAICHPLNGQAVSRQSRAIKCIIVIWILSCVCALPYPIFTRTFHYLKHPYDGSPLKDSLVCSIYPDYMTQMTVVFQFSSFLFFILPMTVITVMYILIGLKLRSSNIDSHGTLFPHAKNTVASRARRAVLRMLVAVVVAFFLCWAPFHAQRLMTVYIKQWPPELMEFQAHVFYISGVLYFISSTVNPILYNLLSRKYRYAFKRTLCRCFIDMDALPSFYQLKARFNNRDENSSTPSARPFLDPAKPARLATFYSMDPQKRQPVENKRFGRYHVSTQDTMLRPPTAHMSTSSTHAHSDGRLHYLCRHRHCSSIKSRNTCSTSTGCYENTGGRNNNRSYQGIAKDKNTTECNGKCHVLTNFDSSLSCAGKSSGAIHV